ITSCKAGAEPVAIGGNGMVPGATMNAGRFVRVETQLEIERPPQQVFAYVTTPALWHTWHPATVEVRDGTGRWSPARRCSK
ncbi:MAG: SRPBCC family protein, partial [Betaproteobacteria bacterium]